MRLKQIKNISESESFQSVKQAEIHPEKILISSLDSLFKTIFLETYLLSRSPYAICTKMLKIGIHKNFIINFSTNSNKKSSCQIYHIRGNFQGRKTTFLQVFSTGSGIFSDPLQYPACDALRIDPRLTAQPGYIAVSHKLFAPVESHHLSGAGSPGADGAQQGADTALSMILDNDLKP